MNDREMMNEAALVEKVFWSITGATCAWGVVLLSGAILSWSSPPNECKRLSTFCMGDDQYKCLEVMVPRCQEREREKE